MQGKRLSELTDDECNNLAATVLTNINEVAGGLVPGELVAFIDKLAEIYELMDNQRSAAAIRKFCVLPWNVAFIYMLIMSLQYVRIQVERAGRQQKREDEIALAAAAVVKRGS